MQEYFNNYLINTDGSVISKSSGKTLKPENCKLGYQRITLCYKGKTKRFLLHRLIALNHIPNPDHLPCVNHKDGDKKNNHVNNLEWCSYSDNEKHSHKVLGKVNPNCEEHYNAKLTAKLVLEIRKINNPNFTELSKIYGFDRRVLSAAYHGKTWKRLN